MIAFAMGAYGICSDGLIIQQKVKYILKTFLPETVDTLYAAEYDTTVLLV